MVEMKLSKIIINETADQQIIVLQEAQGERSFPILIGPYEALAIRRGVREEAHPRPQTHDLLAAVIERLTDGLDHIEITELKKHSPDALGETFFARLVLRHNGELVELDARPSDAVALAVTAKCPILCAEAVLQRACQEP